MKNQCCARGVSYMLCMGCRLPNFFYTQVRKIIVQLQVQTFQQQFSSLFLFTCIHIHVSIERRVEGKVNVICTTISLCVFDRYSYLYGFMFGQVLDFSSRKYFVNKISNSFMYMYNCIHHILVVVIQNLHCLILAMSQLSISVRRAMSISECVKKCISMSTLRQTSQLSNTSLYILTWQ